MQETTNYELPIIEGTDIPNYAPFNEAMNKIDENVKRIDDGLTVQTERVDSVVEEVETTLGETVTEINNTLQETKTEIETEVDEALSSAVNTAPIVAGLDTPSNVSGTADYITCGYANPQFLPIRKPRVNWTVMKATDPTRPSEYFATIPVAYNSQNLLSNYNIGIIKQGLYRIDIDFTIEFAGVGDGSSAMISLVKNGTISGTLVEGQYLHSKYVDLNGDGKQSVHITAYVRQNTDTPITIRPICEISGGTGAYDIVVSDTETITTTVTKVN